MSAAPKVRGSSSIEAAAFARLTLEQQRACLAYIKAAAAHASKGAKKGAA